MKELTFLARHLSVHAWVEKLERELAYLIISIVQALGHGGHVWQPPNLLVLFPFLPMFLLIM